MKLPKELAWLWNKLPIRIKRFLLYNILVFAALSVFYVPYQIFWIQLSPVQLIKWLGTATLFGWTVNIFVQPMTVKIVHWLDKKQKEWELKQ